MYREVHWYMFSECSPTGDSELHLSLVVKGGEYRENMASGLRKDSRYNVLRSIIVFCHIDKANMT